MTTNEQRILSSVWLILVIGVFGVWLTVLSVPKAAEVAAKLQPPTPLPTIAVQQLSQQATGHEIQGALPIDLSTAGLGRQDPFAGQ